MRQLASTAVALAVATTVLAPTAAQADKPSPDLVQGPTYTFRSLDSTQPAHFTYRCEGTPTASTCKGVFADGQGAKWTVTLTGPNEWQGEGKIGGDRLSWSVTGTPTGVPGGGGPSLGRLSMSGSMTASRSADFTFGTGGYSAGGGAYGLTQLGLGAVCGSAGSAFQAPLGASCRVFSRPGTGPEYVALAPVYPGAVYPVP